MSTTTPPVVPLMFTTLGNVPAESLEFLPQWEVVPNSHIKLTLTWRRDGVVVRQDVHVRSMHGVQGESVAGCVGGPPTAAPNVPASHG